MKCVVDSSCCIYLARLRRGMARYGRIQRSGKVCNIKLSVHGVFLSFPISHLLVAPYSTFHPYSLLLSWNSLASSLTPFAISDVDCYRAVLTNHHFWPLVRISSFWDHPFISFTRSSGVSKIHRGLCYRCCEGSTNTAAWINNNKPHRRSF